MKVLITGGAGFIGTNLTEALLGKGQELSWCEVAIFDNLSRPGGGSRINARYLHDKYEQEIIIGDVSEPAQIEDVVKSFQPDAIVHLAAQTAMTHSLTNPKEDFLTNAYGTFNVLEAVRKHAPKARVIYTSTNKVYGDLKEVILRETPTRWDIYCDICSPYKDGIDEKVPLAYEGAYGCSKGAGDAYCLDYHKTFGLDTIVLRMSGIYGTSQRATEDQGWVTWLMMRAMLKQPITIFGDGKQVRDILYVDDLVEIIWRLLQAKGAVGGVYNVGGGKGNSISILELLSTMKELLKIMPSRVEWAGWRMADQKWYVSDIRKLQKAIDCNPTPMFEGLTKLYAWLERSLHEGK